MYVPGLYENSIDNANAGKPLAQDLLVLMIDSTHGHYNYSTVMHITSLLLAFLASVQQRRSLEHGELWNAPL